jgi:hypothetical protein
MAIDGHKCEFDEDEILPNPESAVAVCSSLAMISRDEKSGQKFVLLAHYSVKEFLLSNPRDDLSPLNVYRVEELSTNAWIARCCLSYLFRLESVSEHDSDQNLTERFKLAEYSARFWMVHARAAKEEEILVVPVAMKFFAADNAYSAWIRIRGGDNTLLHPGPGDPEPIEFAAYFGLQQLSAALVAEASALGGSSGGHSHRNQSAIQRILGDVRAKEEAKFGQFMRKAVSTGNSFDVGRYIKDGADLDFVNPGGKTYLELAINEGHVQTARQLLKGGASVKNPALWEAAYQSDVGMIAVLLEAGIDDAARLTGLQMASRYKNLDAMEMLFQDGPVDLQEALSFVLWSVEFDADIPTEWLFQHGAKPTAGMLTLAAGKRDGPAMVRHFLNADLKDRQKEIDMAFISAVRHGFGGNHMETLELLFDAGAQALEPALLENAKDPVRSGDDITRWLLSKGARATDEMIKLAAQNSYFPSKVEALREAGAVLSAEDEKIWQAKRVAPPYKYNPEDEDTSLVAYY